MENRKQQTNTNVIQRRFFDVQSRSSDDGKMVIGGLASTYDQYTNMGGFAEVVRRGFFDGIDVSEAACLKNHNENLVLGRTYNNTLKLTDTADGYDYEAYPPDTTTGRDSFIEVRDGYIYKSSFAFTVKETSWKKVKRSELAGMLSESDLDALTYGGEVEVRELIKGEKLYDVSPVTYPAYGGTSVGKREAELLKEERSRFIAEERDFDEERAKVKVELEIEISTDGEPEIPETPDMPAGTEEDSKSDDGTTAFARQIQINKNRLRLAEAMRAKFI